MTAGPDRHVRAGGDRGPSLAERVAGGLGRLSRGTAVHRLRLRGPYAPRLLATVADPVPGDAALGALLLTGTLAHAGHRAALDWAAGAPPAWTTHAHGFAWLRDLFATADPARAAKVADAATRDWLARFGRYDPVAWSPHATGLRTLAWLTHAPALLATPELVQRSAVLDALARGRRHLDRAAGDAAPGLPRIAAWSGAVAGALLLPDAEARLPAAIAGLARALDVVGADGTPATRAPADALAVVETLLLVEAAFASRGREMPPELRAPAARAGAAVTLLTLGNGRLAAFHGGAARATGWLRSVPHLGEAASGWVRLARGGAILVMDAGPPPDPWHSAAAHAGTLAFELSDGAHRLIVNCGGGGGAPPALAAALRTTAAHSTATIADRNATRIGVDGRLGRGVEAVTVTRDDGPAGAFAEATHDGYLRRFGLVHRRRVFLAADGSELRGEDAFVALGRPAGCVRADIRFHLGPAVTARSAADGTTLHYPGGVWRLRARGASVTLEDSVWLDAHGRVHPTRQVVLGADAPGVVAWTLKRLEPAPVPA